MVGELMSDARRYRRFSEALQPALAADPFYIALEDAVGDPGRSKEAMLCYYDYSIHEAAVYGRVYFPDDDAFGVSVWSLPLDPERASQKAAQKRAFIAGAMGQGCRDTYDAINAFMSAASQSITSEQDWYLSILGILPAYQGRGLGRDLVKPILDEADAAGVATFLETFTPRNMKFYERIGYRTDGEFLEPTTQSTYWLMRRPSP